jgi:hypothetical protein
LLVSTTFSLFLPVFADLPTYEMTIWVNADVGLEEYYPGKNYNDQPYMVAGVWSYGSTYWLSRAMMSFSIANIPLNANITQAKLYVSNKAYPTTINVTAHFVSSTTWDPYTVCWNDQPAHNATAEDWCDGSKKEDGYYVWDLTNIVRQQHNASATLLTIKLLKSNETKSADNCGTVTFDQGAWWPPEEQYDHLAKLIVDYTYILGQGQFYKKDIPLDDIEVESANPDWNFDPFTLVAGNNYATNGFLNTSRIWLKFNISDIPSDAYVYNATVFLYQYAMTGNFNLSIYYSPNNNWYEEYYTWNRFSSFSTTQVPGSEDRQITSGSHWVNWTVTNTIQDGVFTNQSAISFMIKAKYIDGTNETGYACFRQKEYSDENFRPYIEIYYCIYSGTWNTVDTWQLAIGWMWGKVVDTWNLVISTPLLDPSMVWMGIITFWGFVGGFPLSFVSFAAAIKQRNMKLVWTSLIIGFVAFICLLIFINR